MGRSTTQEWPSSTPQNPRPCPAPPGRARTSTCFPTASCALSSTAACSARSALSAGSPASAPAAAAGCAEGPSKRQVVPWHGPITGCKDAERVCFFARTLQQRAEAAAPWRANPAACPPPRHGCMFERVFPLGTLSS